MASWGSNDYAYPGLIVLLPTYKGEGEDVYLTMTDGKGRRHVVCGMWYVN